MDLAERCDLSKCELPYCYCSKDGTSIPGDLEPENVSVINYFLFVSCLILSLCLSIYLYPMGRKLHRIHEEKYIISVCEELQNLNPQLISWIVIYNWVKCHCGRH